MKRVRSAGADAYDDIPYEELPIETVDWQHRADYIRQRSVRKGQPNEFDVEPEWATEAALDPKAPWVMAAAKAVRPSKLLVIPQVPGEC